MTSSAHRLHRRQALLQHGVLLAQGGNRRGAAFPRRGRSLRRSRGRRVIQRDILEVPSGGAAAVGDMMPVRSVPAAVMLSCQVRIEAREPRRGPPIIVQCSPLIRWMAAVVMALTVTVAVIVTLRFRLQRQHRAGERVELRSDVVASEVLRRARGR